MREFLEAQYQVEVRQWAVPTEDGEVYEVVHAGRLIRADSLALLLAEVQGHEPMRPALYVPAFAGLSLVQSLAA